MATMTINNSNTTTRKRFHKFLEDNYQPSLKVLYKAVGVGYSDLCSWNKGSIDYGEDNLRKVDEFLRSKGL